MRESEQKQFVLGALFGLGTLTVRFWEGCSKIEILGAVPFFWGGEVWRRQTSLKRQAHLFFVSKIEKAAWVHQRRDMTRHGVPIPRG